MTEVLKESDGKAFLSIASFWNELRFVECITSGSGCEIWKAVSRIYALAL